MHLILFVTEVLVFFLCREVAIFPNHIESSTVSGNKYWVASLVDGHRSDKEKTSCAIELGQATWRPELWIHEVSYYYSNLMTTRSTSEPDMVLRRADGIISGRDAGIAVQAYYSHNSGRDWHGLILVQGWSCKVYQWSGSICGCLDHQRNQWQESVHCRTEACGGLQSLGHLSCTWNRNWRM